MEKLLKNIIKNTLHFFFYARRSYSQEGEDLVIDRLLAGKKNGFYVEVGCHHPFRFSNTYFFYKRGWRGICIDPLPGTSKSFAYWRPRDTVLEVGVSKEEGVLVYNMFNEPALNTFDASVAQAKDGLGIYRVVERREIPVKRLSAIFNENKISDEIDFLSVDVEGLDLEVLASNDWENYRPKIVVAESLSISSNVEEDAVYKFLVAIGYRFYAKTGNSLIYVDDVKLCSIRS